MHLGSLATSPKLIASCREDPTIRSRGNFGIFIFAEAFVLDGNKQSRVFVVFELLGHVMDWFEKLVWFGKNLIKLKHQLLV